MENYKGYSLFKEETDDLLQAWNRAQTIVNINEKLGEEEAQAYHDNFEPEEKMKVELLLLMVSTSGKEEVQKRVMDTVNEGKEDE